MEMYSKEYQKAVIEEAEGLGYEARPIENENGFDVELLCTACGEWSEDIDNKRGICVICFITGEEEGFEEEKESGPGFPETDDSGFSAVGSEVETEVK